MEEWKDIQGYEGLYQVSTLGRIKGLPRKNRKREIILKPIIHNGYEQVYLCKSGVKKYHSVHRLVAIAFIPNIDNLPYVNHVNENKADNNIENLEWCTAKYNTNYGTGMKRRIEKQKNDHRSIAVNQYDLNGRFVDEYPSISEAGRKTHIPIRAICAVCKGHQKSAFGFIWKYKK